MVYKLSFLDGFFVGGIFVTLTNIAWLCWRIKKLEDETSEYEIPENKPKIINCDKCHSVFKNGNGGVIEVLLCATCVNNFFDDQLKSYTADNKREEIKSMFVKTTPAP